MLRSSLKGNLVQPDNAQTKYLRHITACRTACLPGRRLKFLLGNEHVGWVSRDFAKRLAQFDAVTCNATGLALNDPSQLEHIAAVTAQEGLHDWRGETFDVRDRPDGRVLGRIDRGAVPAFGVFAVGVHVNGLVERPDGLHLWVARRSAAKRLDPGKLDHIVAGGVPAGLTPGDTLIKEAAEEASIPADLAQTASPVGAISYSMERPEGLRRDCLYCYDLILPRDFRPVAADGEVAGFELWPLRAVADAVRETCDFKFNVNLVLIDLLIRTGIISGDDATSLRQALVSLAI
jgi:8-oxo-dGTP pyrophosphatase MutT (NUDIX family)